MWAISSFFGIYIGSQLTPNMLEHTFWFLIAYLAGLVTYTTSHTDRRSTGERRVMISGEPLEIMEVRC
jgi:uncharacterized membrane protein YfcA